MLTAGTSGKAALARTHSKTWRTFGARLAREASWSAERQFRFAPEKGLVAPLEEFSLSPPISRNAPIALLSAPKSG